MKWVTRAHIHVDRVACPWLITRFVDSHAEFIFVAKNQVEEVARAQGATPFDVSGVELGHREDKCSFDAIIHKYDLKDPGLVRLAQIVRAADTDRTDLDPVAAGLEAIATGFSLRFPDDHDNLRHQFAVYDALYAWCRLSIVRSADSNGPRAVR